MRDVTCSMNVSADGYVADPEGGIVWSDPAPEVFRYWTDEIRGAGTHLLGRRLYETMSYWEDPEAQATFDEADRTWAELWKALPKVVFSRTLTDVTGTNTRLATGTVADEIARLRAEPGDGEIAIGGAMLAAEAARHDLIDEYRAIVHPVLVGGGLPFFPQEARRVDLRLVEARTIVDTVVLLRYRVQR
ncbi:dihydrofolate reductase family protein [Cellulosimicrobium composti]|uniref:dihydrofolate reductase family protein n=1 Tax=Cellulosimicrobium composti TaxID=2672572 RepID=UPI0037BD7501